MSKGLYHRLVPVVGIVLVGAALWVLGNELREYHYHDVVLAVKALPTSGILLALLLTVLSYLALTGYETLAFRYIRKELEYKKIALASFIGYAFSHNLGFSMLTGGSVRFRLYSVWGLSAIEITKIVAFCGLTLWVGFFAIGGIAFLTEPLSVPELLHLPFQSVRVLGVILLAAVAGYLLLTTLFKKRLKIGEWEVSLPPPKLSFAQLIISSADWTLAGGVLYMLLPSSMPLSYLGFLGLFLLAQIAGFVSQVPGGVGVFESIIVLLLSPTLPASSVLGSLLVYRAIYYLLPLGVAASLLGFHELLGTRRAVKWAGRMIGHWVPVLVPNVLAIGAFFGGAILLFSGATPTLHGRLRILRDVVPLPLVELSHFAGSLAGAGLLILARGIQRRLDAAYYLTALLLSAGIVVSLLKGLDYEEAIVLTVMLVILLPARHHFYRRASLVSDRFSLEWIAAIIAVIAASIWLGFFSYKHVAYSHDLWWRFTMLAGDAPRFLRASAGVIAVLLFFAIVRLMRSSPPVKSTASSEDLERVRNIVSTNKNTLAHLALLGDKKFLFDDQNEAFIMYAVEGRTWVALGDPVGPEKAWQELIFSFRELSDRHGGWTVFYEVRPEHIHLYLDLGLSSQKIGEEAHIPLQEFSLDGHSRKGLRHSHHKVAKDGYTFEVAPPDRFAELLPQLTVISDTWLRDKRTREKGFSLGHFDLEYLRHFPTAIVHKDNRIVAFANVWPGSQNEEFSVDLMRQLPEAPNGMMDYLFIELMMWGKAQGYRLFNLGVAPFSGLEDHALAPIWTRLGAMVFHEGERFYNFQGLRQYKEKFEPVWEPIYLISPGGLALPRILANIASLISGGLKGVIAK
jgi:phosphatidylglycerol lysyltransferase